MREAVRTCSGSGPLTLSRRRKSGPGPSYHRTFGGYTQVEAAALLGVPLGTVKSRCFHAIRRLRDVLAPILLDGH